MKTNSVEPFADALGEHPGKKMYDDYVRAYAQLSSVEQGLHKVAQTQTYKNYVLAKQYGIQIYNYTQESELWK